MNYDLNVRCTKCSRYMLLKASKSSEVQVRCTDRTCKSWNSIKVVMITDYLPHDHPDKPENKPKSKKKA